jgi:hypothetical protein
MPVLSTRWKLVLVAVVCYVTFAWYFGGDVPGVRKALAQKTDAKKPTPMYFGIAACNNRGCHGGEPPKDWIPGKELLCRCVEGKDWETRDKHADAYNVLTRARGKQMAKILGYDVTKSKACLACHGVYIEDKALEKASALRRFKVEEGVNCVACHGAYQDWVTQHSNIVTAPDWRPKSREVKEAEGGMRNLWDPIKRVELCVSCHVGNTNEGKFVTHEMYAAGHPPLPGFEAAAFSEQMPRHWQYLREKDPKVREELGYKQGEQEQAKLILIGAAVALRETMALLEAQAKTCLTARNADGKVLDLSNFDCYACHHDLQAPSWRQRRGYPGKPGRVPMRPWSTELIKLGIVASAKNTDLANAQLSEFRAGMKKVNDAFSARPYGDPEQIQSAAAAMRKWANAFARKLNAGTIDAKTARALLSRFAPLYAGAKLLDYDSARQVAWSFEVIYDELNGKKGDPRVRKLLSAMDQLLKMKLPKGREKIVEDELKESLEKINAYDPERFRQLLRDLTTALGTKR